LLLENTHHHHGHLLVFFKEKRKRWAKPAVRLFNKTIKRKRFFDVLCSDIPITYRLKIVIERNHQENLRRPGMEHQNFNHPESSLLPTKRY
jgi:hypothetical protein